LLFGAQGAKNESRTFMTRAGIDKLASVAAAAAVLCALAALGERTPPPAPPIEPAVRIPVAPLGYKPPGAFYLTYRLSSAALGFFDDDHLLFTFHIGGLLQRVPDDPADDDDQQIRAECDDGKSGTADRVADA
jgi:hypothetical protein